jgi:sigma-E factor negative regulatory protein RseA
MERISALIDGELADDEATVQLKRLDGDADLADAWGMYHLIGDALRGDGRAMPGFAGTLHTSLGTEPTVLAPRPSRVSSSRARWYAMSAAASVAGVAVVGWLTVLGPQRAVDEGSTLAVAPATSNSAGSIESDLVMAHHEYAASAATPGVGAFIRTVASQEPREPR